jgi:hypothetical protein
MITIASDNDDVGLQWDSMDPRHGRAEFGCWGGAL